MKTQRLYEFINSKNINISLFLYQNKDKLKLDSDLLIFVSYLLSFGDKVLFDPEHFAKDLNISFEKIMDFINTLTSLSYISVDVLKNKSGVMEEYISLEMFNSKIVRLLVESNNSGSEEKSNVYDEIQKEFGRTLSPMEYEIIGAWLESKISEELILEALKEAVFNGVNNLRYIDKILYEWGKKGYKNKADVEKSREKWKNKTKDKNVKKEVFDYNWLEDDSNE